jgi:two-component system, cell cycle response regulator
MGLSRRTVLGATAATAVVLAGLAMGAIGAFTGWGLWLVVLVGGGVLGGTATMVAASIAAAANGSRRRVGGGAPLDPVTGLPSTDMLEADLQTAVGSATEGAPSTLYVFALQGLQRYDEAYGKASGDALLAWLGRKLRGAVRGHGTAYRLQGAKLAVLAGTGEAGELQALVEAALSASGEGFAISCSVGRATLGTDASTPGHVIELACNRAQAARDAVARQSAVRLPEEPIDALALAAPGYDAATLAVAVGERLGLSGEELVDLEAAVHLRDVGNIAIPAAVLNRPGGLRADEWSFIRAHTIVGERLLSNNFEMDRVGALVRSSHERWDGAGYPDGLAGKAIPLPARIAFVCGAFEDMTTKRTHRAARDPEPALAELERGAGTQFDPEVVRAFQEEFEASRELRIGRLEPDPSKRLHVLVAHRDPAVRFLVANAVQDAGHDSVAAQDGASAWEAYRRDRPELVIADRLLPVSGGDELAWQIHTDEDSPTPYIAMLTPPGDERGAPGDGVDELIARPLHRAMIESLLASAGDRERSRQDSSAR